MSYSDAPAVEPMVKWACVVESANALATTTGDTQRAQMGVPMFTKLTSSNLTSGRIVLFGPSKAQVVKFFAEPNPPGITSASISLGSILSMDVILPRAMRAASTNMFLLSCIASPLVWFTTWYWFLSMPIHTASAPNSSIANRVNTASWISAPS